MENIEIKQRLETLYKQQEDILSNIKGAAEHYAKVVTNDDDKENHKEHYDDYTWDIHDELARLANVHLAIKSCNDTLENESVIEYRLNEDKSRYTLIFNLNDTFVKSSFTAGALKRVENELCKREKLESCIFGGIEINAPVIKKEESLFDWIENNVTDMGMVEEHFVETARYYADKLAKITPFITLRNMLSMKDVNVAVPVINMEKFREDLRTSIRPLEEMIEERVNRIELSEKLTIKIADILKADNE